ncbi:mitochondrial FAD carrier protein FLX1 [Trichophyton equinum CBS 127.97]|uniref:Mitochondrial FAD carrier protein FLX1 n=1 Tax=Trichophyton equinum (strain ATCC MYA-4606 / CBS 127.97) TaxID=559882 RepID=F2PV02_TRIEC|nr:mitochondrial FAD carrier protein FLX1 [Trichophyton equinum CBS 127.97]
MNDKNGLSPSLVETIAGFTAGVCSTLVVHPLDIVKTRLQVDRFSSSKIGSSLRIIRGISRNEGGIQAFYRGLTPNLVGNSVSWGLYFLWYGEIKELLSVSRGSGGLTSLDYFVASGTSGAHVPGAYRSMMSGFQQIYRMEGFTGFYQGLIPAMFGVCHGALQFMAYEQLKRYRTRMTQASSSDRPSAPNDTPSTRLKTLSNMDYLLLSGTSKVFAGGVTYPYQVLRTRLQTYDARGTYKGVRDAFVQILRTEGLSGFYKGLGPNLVRVLPSTWVTFLVYENARVYLMVDK